MARDLRSLVENLKAVAHPLRLRVLGLLGAGELCVCQVAEALSVPVSSVSEALRELRRVDFIRERKEGRWVYVAVHDQPSPLLRALLLEIEALSETQQDRAGIAKVKGMSVQEVCQKQLAPSREATHG
jgi:DNA-binding transcriptional ArsR family regulator